MDIRLYFDSDWVALWPVLREVFRAGETYPHPMDITEEAARTDWIDNSKAVYTSWMDDELTGSYYLKPNQKGLGSHVANAGYVVAEGMRGRGIGRALALHSLEAARGLGFRALQFNLVVATNTASVRLWESLGFRRVGTLPRAFLLRGELPVDAHVYFPNL